MAKGKKKNDNAPQNTVNKLKQNDVRSGFAEMDRLREKATTYNGELGAFKKGFCERTRLSVQAVSIISKLDRLGDDLKRQSVMDEVLLLFDVMGWNDQGTLFDRVAARKANSVEKEEEDLRPRFARENSMPLQEAEKAFDAANEVAEAKKTVAAKRAAKLPDALASLAGSSKKSAAPSEPPVDPKLN